MMKTFATINTSVALLLLMTSNYTCASEVTTGRVSSVIDETQWQTLGTATYSVFWFDVYTASLSIDHDADLAFPSVALSLTYHRDIDAADLIENTEEQWRTRKLVDDASIVRWINDLGRIWQDVSDGDKITLVVEANGSSHFFHNDSPVGTIADTAFGPAILSIWTATPNPFPEQQQALLGDNNCYSFAPCR